MIIEGKKMKKLILAAVLCFSGHVLAALSGAGTEASPYLIQSRADFDEFANPANAALYWAAGIHTKLMTDIDLSGRTSSPIGNNSANYKGSFDGNYHTISHLTIFSSIQEHVGLFGVVWPTAEPGTLNCFIKNLGLIDSEIITTYNSYDSACAGALVGKAKSYGGNKVLIKNCYVEGGSVTGYGCVGGLIGSAGCDILRCYSNISVFGNNTVGGFVGNGAESSSFDQCYSLGNVSGTSLVGGFAGILSYKYVGVVSNCYAQGDVDGADNVGGFVGNNGSMNIFNSYSTGQVTGSGDSVGGFAGASSGIINCYWNIETSGQVNSPVGEGKTTAEMMSMETFVGWDCGGAWTIQEGIDYPHLTWEGVPGTPFPQETYNGGSGTLEDPYLISTAEQLNTIRQRYCHLDKSFRLIADIEMNDLPEGEFEPIGSIYPFMGVFDGNEHSISNVQYSLYTDSYNQNVGLFAVVGSPYIVVSIVPEIHDLTLVAPNLSLFYTDSGYHSGAVGSLVGRLTKSIAHDINVIGATVTCPKGDAAGGVFGQIEGYGVNFLVSDISCTANVTGSIQAGGLVGNCNNVELTRSGFSGRVSGSNIVGGLAGNFRGIINQCISEGEILGIESVGGFVGKAWGGLSSIIENSYSVCNLEGSENVGGFCGTLKYVILMNCYSTGHVIGSGGYVGGFIGYHDLGYQNKYPSSFNACFWDIETSGTTDGVGFQYPDPAGVAGKATTGMMLQSTFTGWDFSDTDGDAADWMMLRENEDYPRLAWQTIFAGDIAGLYGVDMEDLNMLIEYWLGTWHVKADIVDDSIVNLMDLSVIGQNWMLTECGDCNGADITGDGNVDIQDTVVFADQWLFQENPDCQLADIDNSGIVDLADLSILAANWMLGI